MSGPIRFCSLRWRAPTTHRAENLKMVLRVRASHVSPPHLARRMLEISADSRNKAPAEAVSLCRNLL